MRIFALDDLYYKNNHAGYKARRDFFEILKANWPEVTFYNFYQLPIYFKKNRVIRVLMRLIKTKINYWKLMLFLNRLQQNDVVVLRYPFEGDFNIAKRIYKSLEKKRISNNIQVIYIILDLDSIRRTDQITIDQECAILASCDVVIPHNKKMGEWLNSNGVKKERIVNLFIFDYLFKNEIIFIENKEDQTKRQIYYAGNLERKKAEFLYKWIPDFDVNLYGINFEGRDSVDKFSWNGIFDANNPDMNISGISFGLVWDGNSIDSSAGVVGNYMIFSTPHKASLYLSQGLPVFIWRHSALSEFIISNNLGFLIDSLSDISEILSNLSWEDYVTMKKEVLTISQNLNSGYFFKKAFSLALEKLNSKDLT